MTHAYTGEKFAVMCDMDAVSIVEKRDKYAKNLPYRKFSAKEMEEIATYSSKSDECWHMLGETLHDQYGYDVEETGAMGCFSGRRINTDRTGGNVAVSFKRRAGDASSYVKWIFKNGI